jgi:hypothetical protein
MNKYFKLKHILSQFLFLSLFCLSGLSAEFRFSDKNELLMLDNSGHWQAVTTAQFEAMSRDDSSLLSVFLEVNKEGLGKIDDRIGLSPPHSPVSKALISEATRTLGINKYELFRIQVYYDSSAYPRNYLFANLDEHGWRLVSGALAETIFRNQTYKSKLREFLKWDEKNLDSFYGIIKTRGLEMAFKPGMFKADKDEEILKHFEWDYEAKSQLQLDRDAFKRTLTKTERLTIHEYNTFVGYAQFNKYLRGQRESKYALALNNVYVRAMRKLPKYVGNHPLNRGVGLTAAQYSELEKLKKGDLVFDRAIMSTSTDEEADANFLAGEKPTTITIRHHFSGRMTNSEESEVTFEPFTTFRVVEVKPAHLILDEVPRDFSQPYKDMIINE